MYAAIMVNVIDDDDDAARIKVATTLAARFGSTLIGVAARMWHPAGLAAGGVLALEPVELEMQEIEKWLKERGEVFRKLEVQTGRPIEWRSATDFPTEFLTRQARAADLVVIGRNRSNYDPYYSLDTGSALLNMGRPVLVVPDNVSSLEARRVIVAWKDTREARRAVRDAIPLLRSAKEVLITEIIEDSDSQGQKHVDDVSDYLVRHQVIVAAKFVAHAKGTAAAELIRIIHDQGADLIVAGAYGHTRMGEWIFGGVTRELLVSSAICCLFTH